MGFWDTVDGEDARKTDGTYDSGAGDFEPIPAGTQVLMAAEQASWDTIKDSDEQFVSIRWTVLQPEQYKNRKIFQKVRVNYSEPGKRDKAKRMLAAIDANAGGSLIKSSDMPSDADLARALFNRPMIGLVQVWKLKDAQTGEEKTGNFIAAVSPRNKKVQPMQKPEQEPVKRIVEGDGSFDDDIPF